MRPAARVASLSYVYRPHGLLCFVVQGVAAHRSSLQYCCSTLLPAGSSIKTSRTEVYVASDSYYTNAMGNKFSKPGGPIRVLSKQMVTDIRGKKIITLRLEDYTPAYIHKTLIRTNIIDGDCFIPYLSSEALRQVSTASPASEAQCKNRAYGVVTGIYMTDSVDAYYTITCQLYLPNIIARIAMGSNPPGICTTSLKKLCELGNVFRQPQGCAPKIHEDDDESQCVVCMEYEPRFWWSECESDHGGKFPLICHRCYNNLRRRAAHGKSIRGTPAPTLPCFICQKPGMLISQSSRDGAAARVKETNTLSREKAPRMLPTVQHSCKTKKAAAKTLNVVWSATKTTRQPEQATTKR